MIRINNIISNWKRRWEVLSLWFYHICIHSLKCDGDWLFKRFFISFISSFHEIRISLFSQRAFISVTWTLTFEISACTIAFVLINYHYYSTFCQNLMNVSTCINHVIIMKERYTSMILSTCLFGLINNQKMKWKNDRPKQNKTEFKLS